MTTFRLTCCGDSLSCGVPDGMAYADLPPLQYWLELHHDRPMHVSTLHPEPLPRRAPQRKRAVKDSLQPELFVLPGARREPGAGGNQA